LVFSYFEGGFFMFSETNDTLNSTPSAEDTVDNVQAEGAEGSDSQSSSTPQGTPGEKLYAGKYRTVEEMERGYQELQRLNSRKATPAETAKALGLEATPSAQQAPATRAQVQQVQQAVQQASPNSEWVKRVVAAGYSEGDAYAMIAEARATSAAQNAVAQALGPVADRQNQLAIKTVSQELSEEYDDFAELSADIGKYLEANPGVKAAILSKDSDEAIKRYHLENAYLRVAKMKVKNTTTAAKAAGSVDSKRQEAMKASTVTGGAGARGSAAPEGGTTKAKEFAEAAKRMNEGSRLFE
jgi:hypothetical protein